MNLPAEQASGNKLERLRLPFCSRRLTGLALCRNNGLYGNSFTPDVALHRRLLASQLLNFCPSARSFMSTKKTGTRISA